MIETVLFDYDNGGNVFVSYMINSVSNILKGTIDVPYLKIDDTINIEILQS